MKLGMAADVLRSAVRRGAPGAAFDVNWVVYMMFVIIGGFDQSTAGAIVN